MPANMVKKWAQEKGMDQKEAERRWRKAKKLAAREGRNPEMSGNSDDWRYVVGIFKTMMRKRTKPKVAEHLICKVLEGAAPSCVIQDSLRDLTQNIPPDNPTTDVGVDFSLTGSVKTFFDGEGRLRFCDENDVLINPRSDYRLLELAQYAESLNVDNPLFDLLEAYEGSLEQLYKKVTDAFSLATFMT